MGLYPDTEFFRSSDFGTGTTLASFHSVGSAPLARDVTYINFMVSAGRPIEDQYCQTLCMRLVTINTPLNSILIYNFSREGMIKENTNKGSIDNTVVLQIRAHYGLYTHPPGSFILISF